jgi:hypothetical protein
VSETQYGVAELEERIVAWPGKIPRRRRRPEPKS